MPTGYTATLMEKGQDFRSFVLMCARGMGACIMQRDDPMGEPPKKQKPSDYATNALKTAQERVAFLKAMSEAQRIAHGMELRQKAVDSAKESRRKALAENERLDEMASQVRAWEPPTAQHQGLKDFMLQQIQTSRNDPSWSDKWLDEATDKTPEAYFVEAVSKAVRDLAYYADENAKEVKRTNDRNEWIDKLYESLPT